MSDPIKYPELKYPWPQLPRIPFIGSWRETATYIDSVSAHRCEHFD